MGEQTETVESGPAPRGGIALAEVLGLACAMMVAAFALWSVFSGVQAARTAKAAAAIHQPM